MSIFSGWEAGDGARLKAALTGSPQGLVILAVFVLILIALVFILVQIISHQVSNFYMNIAKEDEDDDENAPAVHAGAEASPTETAEREEL